MAPAKESIYLFIYLFIFFFFWGGGGGEEMFDETRYHARCTPMIGCNHMIICAPGTTLIKELRLCRDGSAICWES